MLRYDVGPLIKTLIGGALIGMLVQFTIADILFATGTFGHAILLTSCGYGAVLGVISNALARSARVRSGISPRVFLGICAYVPAVGWGLYSLWNALKVSGVLDDRARELGFVAVNVLWGLFGGWITGIVVLASQCVMIGRFGFDKGRTSSEVAESCKA
jgi:hypothetical protein